MTKADSDRLRHIDRYCEDVKSFVVRFGKDFNSFQNDRAYHNAVTMAIMQIGELANGLSDEFRAQTKNKVAWGPIRGMRNWIAHAYSEVDDEVVWDTINNDLPQLQKFCKEQIRIYERGREEPELER